MFKELFMKYENVRCLLNRKECYGHHRDVLLEHCSEVYSVMVHMDDFKEYKHAPYSHYVKPDARFVALTLITDPNSRGREIARPKKVDNPNKGVPIDKDYWWKVAKK